jgi:hypothetical protein
MALGGGGALGGDGVFETAAVVFIRIIDLK